MAVYYCYHCGKANSYDSVKPNFCGYCGKSLSLSSSKPAPVISSPTREPSEINLSNLDEKSFANFKVNVNIPKVECKSFKEVINEEKWGITQGERVSAIPVKKRTVKKDLKGYFVTTKGNPKEIE